VRVTRAARAAGPIRVDGRLEETSWRQAAAATSFVQQAPTPGAAASQRTEARVLYTDDALYVGMRLYDSAPDSVAAQLARRDAAGIYSDWAQVIVDSYHDRRTAFRFAVNPAGVLKDVLHFNDGGGEDASWDAVWEGAAHVDSLGWTAEFRIPLSQLRFSPADSVWGVQFLRDIARNNERAYWAPIPPTTQRFVSLFGELTGLHDLGSARRLELRPYVRGSVTRAPGTAGNPFFRANDLGAKVGADVRYPLTPGLTLSATVNPDFGQVEADPSVVNLTAFEAFFPERRPFFVEGTGIFRFGLGLGGSDSENEQLFYSRRVGRPPQGTVPDSAVYRDGPSETTILGAAKLAGRTRGGWSLGLLQAVTRRETALYTIGTGEGGVAERQTAAIEPASNYAVLRAIRDFRSGQSAVGAIATATNRRLSGTELDFLHSGAYAAGLDGRHRFGGGAYEVSGQLVGSHVTGSALALSRTQRSAARFFQRPDNAHATFDSTRTSLTGAAASASLLKLGGNWQWSVLGLARSPGFEVNDLGYQQLADYVVGGGFVGYSQFRPGRVLNDWGVSVGGNASSTFGLERTGTGANVNARLRLRSFWGGYLYGQQGLAALSVSELRGGPAIRIPARTDAGIGMYSDARRPVNGRVDVLGSREDETGGWSLNATGTVNLRATGQLELSLGPQLSWRRTPWQYVAQPVVGAERHYVFGALRQRTVALTTRLNYTFSPTLSLQVYGQPFISAGDYSAFTEVADPKARRFGDRFRTFTRREIAYDATAGTYDVDLDADGGRDFRFGNPDFNVKQFRSNAVLRWEFQPGSTLFLVWSQARDQALTDGTFSLDRDFARLFGLDDAVPAPATNVLLVKVSYWFDL